jgi:signal transduction histidine kinase
MSELPKEIEERVQHMLPRELLHDLRTPLGHILGYSELLIEQMQEGGHEEFIPYLQKIRTAGNQLLEMMTDNFKSGASVGAGDRSTPAASPPVNT